MNTLDLDRTGRSDVVTGGVRVIPITTPIGTFKVWTKRVGTDPTRKVLLLHGGPCATHDYFEAFDSFLAAAGVEYYDYDQLGSGRSDTPGDPRLWDLELVDEVEQVRRAIGLGPDNLVLLGHSWGGIFAVEYAPRYSEALKSLAEIQSLEAARDIEDPRYRELLDRIYCIDHVFRMPADDVLEPVSDAFSHLTYDLYLTMQGPSEMGIWDEASNSEWDRTHDLEDITVPTPVLGARYDTMDPTFLEMMATQIPKGSSCICENGSHMAMDDDQEAHFVELLESLSSFQSPPQ